MIGWWPADGDASDLVGGHHATLRGNTATGAGVVDQAFVLDGDGDFVEVGHDPALNFGDRDFTVDLWVNFSSSSGEQVLIEKWIQRFPGSSGWTLTKLENNVLRLALADDGTGFEMNVDSRPLPIASGVWTHFAVTREGQRVVTYMNGVPVGIGYSSQNLDSAASLKFGHRGDPLDTPGSQDTRGFFLNGRIDEVEIFDRALPREEILQIIAAGAKGKCKMLVYNAAEDFSTTQGFRNCYYLDWTGTGYDLMTYGTDYWVETSWHGNCGLSECFTACIDSVLYQIGGHPNSCDHAPSRAWVSPRDGVVRVTGNAHKLDPNGGDGVDVDILKNDRLLWSRTIAFDDAVGYDFDLTVPVKAADGLYFRIHQRLAPNYDATYFVPTIIFLPER